MTDTRSTRDRELRHPYTVRFKGKAIDWLEATAAKHGIDKADFARELFAMGSLQWQREHPEDIDPAVNRA